MVYSPNLIMVSSLQSQTLNRNPATIPQSQSRNHSTASIPQPFRSLDSTTSIPQSRRACHQLPSLFGSQAAPFNSAVRSLPYLAGRVCNQAANPKVGCASHRCRQWRCPAWSNSGNAVHPLARLECWGQDLPHAVRNSQIEPMPCIACGWRHHAHA